MSAIGSLARLQALGVPFVRTSDAAAALDQTVTAASQILRRLAAAGLVRPVRHGAWWLEPTLDPHRLPEYLSSPMPAYISVHTALYVRGVIEQIPAILYAVTLARSQRIRTTVGTFSMHHIAPELFGGYEEAPGGIKLATAEKALFDFAYLGVSGHSKRFAALPEMELPPRFRHSEVQRWLRHIASPRARTLTDRRLATLLQK